MTAAPPALSRRLTLLRLLALLAVVGITVLVFSLRDRAEDLAAFGYPGIFVLSLLANATLILPAPGWAAHRRAYDSSKLRILSSKYHSARLFGQDFFNTDWQLRFC